LLLYSSKSSLGVYQLAGLLLQANKFFGTIITAPSVARTMGGLWLPSGSPPSLLWTLSLVRKNRNFGFCFVQFREYFLCNFSKTKKQQKTGN
jgi:hypothetical protein